MAPMSAAGRRRAPPVIWPLIPDTSNVRAGRELCSPTCLDPCVGTGGGHTSGGVGWGGVGWGEVGWGGMGWVGNRRILQERLRISRFVGKSREK